MILGITPDGEIQPDGKLRSLNLTVVGATKQMETQVGGIKEIKIQVAGETIMAISGEIIIQVGASKVIIIVGEMQTTEIILVGEIQEIIQVGVTRTIANGETTNLLITAGVTTKIKDGLKTPLMPC